MSMFRGVDAAPRRREERPTSMGEVGGALKGDRIRAMHRAMLLPRPQLRPEQDRGHAAGSCPERGTQRLPPRSHARGLVGSWGGASRAHCAGSGAERARVRASRYIFFFFFCEAEGLALRQRNPTSLSARRGSGCRILSQAFACRTKSRKSELRGCC